VQNYKKKKNQLTQTKKLLDLQKQCPTPTDLSLQLEITKKKLAQAEKLNLERELELANAKRELQLLQDAFLTANGLITSLQNELSEAQRMK